MKMKALLLAMVLAAGPAAAQLQIMNIDLDFLTLHNCGSAVDLGDYQIDTGDTLIALPSLVLPEGERFGVTVGISRPIRLLVKGALVDTMPYLGCRWMARTIAPEVRLGTYEPTHWLHAHCGGPYTVPFSCDAATPEESMTLGALKARYR